ncbi:MULTISPECIES: RluA family pseudouridine synthase [unclassified Streptomyces]|uniref:RluA family pseudouridine synthase n=1 Tax=unclassified Streptomyces TaxID=2593676 RepID=UPI001BE6E37B|nr:MULTISPECIES: RluA family pseudouridine synthase [unclassified Streptomyces]MBT2403727.1 RluA family pseudouridine synthase [Streptomyces sp. ISL-21]MBT2459741.1 RluA family pseudouridine synthase [Streptomyces sp. ISL-86]MBT2611216.1 RluA family pseudouridine synthase [Streptomyces sp. ISL-87]
MRRRPIPPAPLPQLAGIDPVRLRLPSDPEGMWPDLGAYLAARYAGTRGAETMPGLLRSGRVLGEGGRVLRPDDPYEPGSYLWFHRDMPAEPPVPFPIGVVYRDEHLLVADKPHFLATTPRGSHVTQTALARLREELDLPALSPAHRLDRLTAGLVMFSIRPEDRGAYQLLFQNRQVDKEYEALAPLDPGVALPRTVRSRIEKTRGVIAAAEIPGAEPNAETLVELADAKDGVGRYRLTPHTGRTHQLRVHMNSLGLPILGDPVYPDVTDPDPRDYRRPLQLLARVLSFTDPVTGAAHRFESRRTLRAWQDRAAWESGT